MTPFKFPATFLSLDVKERKKVPSTRNLELGTFHLLAANAIHYTTAAAYQRMQILTSIYFVVIASMARNLNGVINSRTKVYEGTY